MHTAVIPLGERVPSTDPAYSSLQERLGHVLCADDGKMYRLVQATNGDGTSGRKKVYKYTSRLSYTVELDTGINTMPAGVGLEDQKSLSAGDLFYLQIRGRATCVASAAIAADAFVEGTSSGKIVTKDAVAVSADESATGLGVTAEAASGDGDEIKVDLQVL